MHLCALCDFAVKNSVLHLWGKKNIATKTQRHQVFLRKNHKAGFSLCAPLWTLCLTCEKKLSLCALLCPSWLCGEKLPSARCGRKTLPRRLEDTKFFLRKNHQAPFPFVHLCGLCALKNFLFVMAKNCRLRLFVKTSFVPLCALCALVANKISTPKPPFSHNPCN